MDNQLKLPLPEPLNSIGKKWIDYAQEDGDTNDIAYAIWSALHEAALAESAVASLPAGWISVDKQLPEFDFEANQGPMVLHLIAVLIDGSVCAINYMNNSWTKEESKPDWSFPDGRPCPKHYVTHWMPLLAAPQVAPAQPSAFPERDTSKPAEQQGIFRKFEVRRTDGSDAPGGKHHGCRYFVLDLDHDKAAPAAMTAYAAKVAGTHPQLAAEISAEYGAVAQPSAVTDDALTEFPREDANNYCRIISLLGMEEDEAGDPVAKIQALIDQVELLSAQRDTASSEAVQQLRFIDDHAKVDNVFGTAVATIEFDLPENFTSNDSGGPSPFLQMVNAATKESN